MAFYVRTSDYFKLATLAFKRKASPDHYFKFQEFQGFLLTKYLLSKGVPLNGERILDLGCGLGGYTKALIDSGSKVYGVDLTNWVTAKRIPITIANAFELPFPKDSFDSVICASLIEHVPDPNTLLNSIQRVVRPGGFIYLSFPPFYSPIGGHQFAPFHLFGEKCALYIYRKLHSEQKDVWYERSSASIESYDYAYGAWGLYPLTIKFVSQLITRHSFRLIDRSTRWLPLDLSGIPGVGELFTWHVQFLLQNP